MILGHSCLFWKRIVVTVFVFFILICTSRVSGQTQDFWIRTYGGSLSDEAYSVCQTSDGGFIACGYTESYDGDLTDCSYRRYSDAWIIKLNAQGFMEWSRTYGGNDTDVLTSIEQTADGGYIAAGFTYSNDGDIHGFHQTSDGLGADVWLMKLDSSGNVSWSECFGGTEQDGGFSVIQSEDMGYVVAGHTQSYDGDVTENKGYNDAWVIKTDSAGNMLWQKSYGGSRFESAKQIRKTGDGGYIFSGYSDSNDGDVSGGHGKYECWIVKLDSSGNIEWQKLYGGSQNDWASSIFLTQDNGYIFVGSTYSNDGDISGRDYDSVLTQCEGPAYWVLTDDIWLVKLNNSGEIEWEEYYGGTNNDWENSVIQCSDGSFLIAGSANSDDGNLSGLSNNDKIWVIKTDPLGEIISQIRFGGFGYPHSLKQSFDGGYVIAGMSDDDFLVAKFDANLQAYDHIFDELVFPNPTNSILHIPEKYLLSAEFYNIYGQKILSATERDINVSWFPSGVYFIVINNSKRGPYIQKFIKTN